MKLSVFIKPVEGSITDCIRNCFNMFWGVDSVVKGNVFIKITQPCPKPQL